MPTLQLPEQQSASAAQAKPTSWQQAPAGQRAPVQQSAADPHGAPAGVQSQVPPPPHEPLQQSVPPPQAPPVGRHVAHAPFVWQVRPAQQSGSLPHVALSAAQHAVPSQPPPQQSTRLAHVVPGAWQTA
jgi:hypothetical protein